MNPPPTISLGKRKIGPGFPCYIIAEMSANHGHSYDQALSIIQAAKKAGADAVKLQTYTPDTITMDSDAPWFRIGKGTIWEGKNLYALYKEAYTPWEWQPKLKIEAEALGLDCFSSPFDSSSVDFLEEMNVPAAKTVLLEDPVRDTSTADALDCEIREMTAQKSNLEAAKRKEEDKGAAAKVEEEEDVAAAEKAAAEKAAADAKVVILTNI